MIAKQSKWFRDRLSPPSSASSTAFSELLKLDTEIFRLYVQYVYTRKLPCKYKPCKGEGPDDIVEREYNKLVDLYFLSRRFQDTEAMDAVISALLCRYQDTGDSTDGNWWLPSFSAIEKVYGNKGCTATSKLKCSLRDIYVWESDPNDIGDDPEELPAASLFGIAKATLGKHDRPEGGELIPNGVSCCDYHHHPKDVQCASRKRTRVDDDDSDDGDDDDDYDGSKSNEEGDGPGVESQQTIEALQKQLAEMQKLIAERLAEVGEGAEGQEAVNTKPGHPG